MKILKTNDFVSERLKVKPITNAELDNARKEMPNIVKPGDDLCDGDVVLVACECLTGTESADINCGTFYDKSDVISYPKGRIRYWNRSLSWKDIKDEYQWTYDDAYTHYILKVYRPYPGKEWQLNPVNDRKISMETLENSHDYYCVYENKELLKKFGLE